MPSVSVEGLIDLVWLLLRRVTGKLHCHPGTGILIRAYATSWEANATGDSADDE